MKLAFVGLGVMGFPMAGHLQRAGHDVCVFNRTAAKAAQWVTAFGGAAAPTPAEAARSADLVFACVGNDDDVRQIAAASDGALAAMKAGSVFVDHTTASADLAREISHLAAERDLGFVDAPVSGGQAGAENGQLTIMCGGQQHHFDQALPILEVYGRKVERLGDVGAGQLCKAVNQICLAGLIQALAEGLNFADKVGLDRQAVVNVISKGAAQSWQMDNRHRTMIGDQYDHGFAVDWMRKDLGIAMDEGRRIGAALPITEMVDQFYAEVQALGGGRWDTSSLLRRLAAQDESAA